MKGFTKALIAVVSVGALAAPAVSGAAVHAPAAANGFTNGSFEGTTNAGPGYFDTLGAGSTAIPGWTVTAGSIDWLYNYGPLPTTDGTKNIDLNGNDAGSIAQTFATTAGRGYHVTLDTQQNPGCGVSTGSLKISAASDTKTVSVGSPAQKSFDFTATGGSTTLSFESLIGSCGGPTLDNVKVVVGKACQPQSAAYFAALESRDEATDQYSSARDALQAARTAYYANRSASNKDALDQAQSDYDSARSDFVAAKAAASQAQTARNNCLNGGVAAD